VGAPLPSLASPPFTHPAIPRRVEPRQCEGMLQLRGAAPPLLLLRWRGHGSKSEVCSHGERGARHGCAGSGTSIACFFSKKSITAGDGFFHLAVMVLYAVVYVVGSWVTTSSLGKAMHLSIPLTTLFWRDHPTHRNFKPLEWWLFEWLNL